MIDAGKICPDDGVVYKVVYLNGHKTLRIMDFVVMREHETKCFFVRISDATVHSITDDHGYVIVEPTPPSADPMLCLV